MTRHFTNWLAAGCLAATIAIHQPAPAPAQDSADQPPQQSVLSASRSIENRLQKLGSFRKSTLTSQLVGVRVSILRIDAQVANEVFFSSEMDFTALTHRLAPDMTLNVEERQQAFSWNRVVRTELVPRLLEEVERRQTGVSPAIIAESHVVGLLGRESSQRMAIPLSGSLLAAGTDDPEFSGLKLIRLTPSLPSSDRVRLETVFTLQQNHSDPEVAPKYIVKSARTLLHEHQSLAVLLRESDDDDQGLLVLLTPGQAQPVSPQPKQTSSTTSTDRPSPPDTTVPVDGEQETVAADTTIPDTSLPENQAQLLKEIRELRSLIQDIRGDVRKLQSVLANRDTKEASSNEIRPADGRLRIQVGQSIQFGRDSVLFRQGQRVSRISIDSQSVLDARLLAPQHLSFKGLRPGISIVRLWFDNVDAPQTLAVQVYGPPEPVEVLLTPHQSEAHHTIEKALDNPVEIDADNTPLIEVLRQLKEQCRINVVVDVPALEEEGFTTNEPVSMHLSNITLRSALRILLENMNLGWVIKNEVLTITSNTRLAGRLKVQAYQITELARADAAKEEQLERITEMIIATVAPDSWAEVGGQGTIRSFPGGDSLVIRQTEEVHDEIQILLQSLTRLLQTSSSNAQPSESSVLPARPAPKAATSSKIPVRVIDRLQTETGEFGSKQPVVVVQPPLPTQSPDPFDGLSFRQWGRNRGRIVDDGNPTTSAVRTLPPVGVSNGRYVDLKQSTVAMVVRHYAPSRTLLMSFHEEGDSDADVARKLIERIRSSINPDSWKDQDVQAEVILSGRIYFYIRHTPHTHDRIRRLLDRMEADVKDDEASTTEQAATADPDGSTDLWQKLGMKVQPVPADELGTAQSNYRGGLRITEVRRISPASFAGLQQGDVLVGLDKWETASLENLNYVLKQIAEGRVQPGLKFFVVRDSETLYGQLSIVPQPE